MTFLLLFCPYFPHVDIPRHDAPQPFGKHLSVIRPAFVVEELVSRWKVVCFPATILAPLNIVHLVLNCSGMTFLFSSLKLVVIGEIEIVIKQRSLLELLMTKNLLALSALTGKLSFSLKHSSISSEMVAPIKSILYADKL